MALQTAYLDLFRFRASGLNIQCQLQHGSGKRAEALQVFATLLEIAVGTRLCCFEGAKWISNLSSSLFPLQTFLSVPSGLARCEACRLFAASYVTYNDSLAHPNAVNTAAAGTAAGVQPPTAPMSRSTTMETTTPPPPPTAAPTDATTSTGLPCLFCEACHLSLHYTAQGQLHDAYADNEHFRVFPHLPPGF